MIAQELRTARSVSKHCSTDYKPSFRVSVHFCAELHLIIIHKTRQKNRVSATHWEVDCVARTATFRAIGSGDCKKLWAAIISWSQQPIVIIRIWSSEPLRNECQWLFDSHSNWNEFARPVYRQYHGATLLLHTLVETIRTFLGSENVKN